MRRQNIVMAIDLGTSGPKVGWVSEGGKLLGWEFVPVELLMFPGGGAEQDPNEWWSAICTATRRLLQKGMVMVDEIAAICCTAQWNGTVAIDRSGQPLMNALIWLDSRGAPYVHQLTRGLLSIAGYDVFKLLANWIRLTGGAPTQSGKDPIGHILYIKHEHPDVYAHTHKFLEPKDYVNFRLTGKIAASCDSIAMHWLTDNRHLDRITYVPRLFRLLGLDPDKFPPLGRAVDILGTLTPQAAEELGLQPDVQVVMGTPDMHATAVGSGAVLDFQPHLYIGTSSWISCHVPFKRTDALHAMLSLPAAIPDRYLVINEQDWAAGCLNYLLDNLIYCDDGLTESSRPDNPYQLLNQVAASAPPGANKMIFTPWLYGERSPVEDAWVRGCFFNLSPNKNRAHLIRSVFEGVAYNARWLFTYLERFVRQRLDGIHMVGGGAVSDLWCQIFADVLGRTVHQLDEPRLVALRGAALIAQVALGHLEFNEIPKMITVQRTYRPNAENRSIYDDLYREFVNLYRATRPIYARLNAHDQE